MAPPQIKTVLVVGASGIVGTQAIKHLLASNFQVSALIRSSSTSTPSFPSEVRIFKTDYTPTSLRPAFANQDAVLSTISGEGLALQRTLVDAAIAAGVKVFFPSEFGIDTTHPDAATLIPFLKPKIETLEYLETKQDRIAWTSIVSGSLCDWSLDIPSFGGIDVPGRKATIYDDGDVKYDATTSEQVGRAIAAVMKQPLDVIANQHVYVNSFTVTQKEVLAALEHATGEKFAISYDTVENLRKVGKEKLAGGNFYGMLELIASSFYGRFGVADFSIRKGLWNERLGLRGEQLEGVVREYVKRKEVSGWRVVIPGSGDGDVK
ncbi:hypothetical protein M409DRAFT_54252 [Zasmidium cellare ATCC 36951]|uniref:NmrA-like domain-containing protein n=1 Tax=Zasmidium cellare ATCC 36951 TaxID=1080233 RepID=A0A6A6CLF7_ZASCE|nr:uncharacterized protein M409DRAFT_54252 [Zasmidium cellare ATCC 36951]KAF2167038.1 hypothetical protein M409DRAFT_54252 [Zasmidium cellare ATCC 36951]